MMPCAADEAEKRTTEENEHERSRNKSRKSYRKSGTDRYSSDNMKPVWTIARY